MTDQEREIASLAIVHTLKAVQNERYTPARLAQHLGVSVKTGSNWVKCNKLPMQSRVGGWTHRKVVGAGYCDHP